MLLKQLDIHGFKSFADKTEIQFNPGVTVIVGPNGSGKSNVLEAVRWVLGEQSAKSLRGSRMEDVIFAGSNKRKALGFAEVSLTVDNSTGVFPLDFAEITVTRRVYRSGESEFLINKTPCRLRDIHDLFTDTGIGKDGYSLIGQGKIEEIITSKPEERRSLIEEAAGIVKYRNRKAQAVKKLTETEVSLLRINDIISELEGQRGPLAEQAEEARKYLALKEELTSLEINYCVHQLEEVKEKLAQVREQMTTLGREVMEEEGFLVSEESKIEEDRLELSLLEEKMSGEQQLFFNLSQELDRTESEVRVAEERLRGLVEQQEKAGEEIVALEKNITALSLQYAEEETRWQAVRSNLKENLDLLARAENESSSVAGELAAIEASLEDAKGEVIDLLNRLANKRNEIKYLEADGENLENRRAQAGEKLEALAKQISLMENSYSEKNKFRSEENSRLEEWEKRSRELTGEIAGLHRQLEEVKKEKGAVFAARQQKLSRANALKEMQDDYEGYHRGVKEVMQSAKGAKHSLKGIHGVVAEIVKVPARLEKAVESVLGQALQFIVTENEDSAKTAISFLKDKKAGRATFLPLTTVQGQGLNTREKEALKIDGVLGSALDLVSYDARYDKVLSSLLGRIAVTDNMDTALKVAQKAGFAFRVVTLDGDLIHPGGSMTGGSALPQKTALLGRLREIEELTEAVGVLDVKIKSLAKKEEAAAARRGEAEKEVDRVRDEQEALRLSLAGLDKEIQAMEEHLQRLKDDLYLRELEERQLSAEKEEALTQLEKAKTEMAQLEALNKVLEQKMEDYNGQLARLQQEHQEKLAGITSIKVKAASLEQEEVGLAQALGHFHRTRDGYRDSVARKQEEVQGIGGEKAELQDAIEEKRQKLGSLFSDKEERSQALANLRSERQAAGDAIAAREKDLRLKQKMLQEKQRELHMVELKETRLDSEWETALARLMDEYGLSFEQALLEKKEIQAHREVKSRIKQLKVGLEELGLVNLGAIEEYDRVNERYHFLSKQSADLHEAKASLYRVIEEMDQIMVKRFREAYREINSYFSEVFTELFGGGHAELMLTDGENILEAGVDINAQPPGKKLQNLTLLSGGEKALTAISLLFALLKTKPSPFFILDEIESSLDEPNVDRFASFLRDYSRQTQFVAISHRKGTMEAADVLYGVTMEGSGVSKVVSMKMTGEEKVS